MLTSLAPMVPALAEVVRRSAIRILDLVAVTTDANGVARIIEVDEIGGFDGLRRIDIEIGGLLSSHDIDLVSLALAPDSAAIVVVVEDWWAAPLSAAARRSGGEVLAGERIPRSRVEAALAGLPRKEPMSSMDRTQSSRDRIPDLLTRPPLLRWQVAAAWPHPLVDPVRQLEALADLLDRGLLSRDEFERQKQKVHSE